MAGAANPPHQTSVGLGSGSINPTQLPVQGPASSLTEGPISQHAPVTQHSGPNQASITWPPKYEKDDSTAFVPRQRPTPTQRALSELEQQGGAPAYSPAGQIPAALQAADIEELTAVSTQNPRGGHRSQHTLSEQEQQGSLGTAAHTAQGSMAQPLPRAPSPEELELVASQQATGGGSAARRSLTRDLTELEQQGSFTLARNPSQSQVENLRGAEAAELARELAQRKGAQAELERQYSQLQLQHQQVSLPLQPRLCMFVCVCL